MLPCKKCQSTNVVKSGKVRQKQRYKCKDCVYHFTEGDGRTNAQIIAMKAMCVLFYALAKGSYNMLGKMVGRHRSLIYRWIRQAGAQFAEPEISGEIKELEFDEMWHYVKKKQTSFGSSKPLIAAHAKPWPGCSVLVILQPSQDFTTR